MYSLKKAENSISYKLPCNLIEAEFNKPESIDTNTSFDYYHLLRKLIDLNKAYYLSLNSQLPSIDATNFSKNSFYVELIEDDDLASTSFVQQNFSENLSTLLLDESLSKLSKYDQFASNLVEDLFNDLRTSSLDDLVNLHSSSNFISFIGSPLNVIIPENDELLERDNFDGYSTLTSNSTNSSSYYYGKHIDSFIHRRHSADVEKILFSNG